MCTSWHELLSERVLDRRDCGVTTLHRTNKVGEVSGRRISEAGGERLLPRPGNLVMQVREERQLSPHQAQTRATEESSSSLDDWDSQGSSGQSKLNFSVVRAKTSTSL